MSSQPFTIFVVEDDDWYSKLLVHNLSLNPDFEVQPYKTGQELIDALHKRPNVITLDYRLPDISGNELLKKIKDFDESIEVVVISEQQEIETAVELLKLGAFDYLVKTKDIRDRLLNTVNHIRTHTGLKRRIANLEKEVQQKYELDTGIIGASEPMKKVMNLISKAITTNITVTVTGETGTGKEVVAKAIHYNSKRKEKPFVAVNMAAIPAELTESELFGHEKGAFTGASTRRIGKFEEAHQGTLFLDEIGEMDLNLQVKLLRALQEKEIIRVGSNKPIKTDCRIIVATNKDLKAAVKEGNFREDLYFRLYGLPIELPPLRERANDVILLAKHFIDLFCDENDVEPKTLTEGARKKLLSYHWPGNVREVKSVVELAVVMSGNSEIDADDITLSAVNSLSEVVSEEMTLREYERKIVKLFLDRYDNNTKLVAEKLDIGQTTIYRMLKEERETNS